MVTRAQLDRISARIDRLTGGDELTVVPVYDGESADAALELHVAEVGPVIRERPLHFNRAPVGLSRDRATRSGLHPFFRFSPREVSGLLKEIDGKTRSIPTTCAI